MKKFLKIIGIILGVFVLLIVVMMVSMFVKLGSDMKNLNYAEVNMSDVADGTYEGIAETTMVKATVSVTVEAHKITEIKILRHENGKGAKAESIVDTMIVENTYQVDGISGATTSSNVIKSAVSNALEKGVTKND